MARNPGVRHQQPSKEIDALLNGVVVHGHQRMGVGVRQGAVGSNGAFEFAQAHELCEQVR